jgi:DNA-binding NtrC family response regulator
VTRSLALVFDRDEKRRECVSAALAADCAVHESAQISDLSIDACRVHPAVVIIGFAIPESSEVLAAIERLHAADRRLSVVLVTNGGSEDIAIAALRAGVKDYLREPLDTRALAACVRRCLASDVSRHPPRTTGPTTTDPHNRFIGSSRSMQALGDYLVRVAQSEATVLITGETGTGKELAAERIHDYSARRSGRFVSVNCAAIPDSLLESELFGYESGAFTGAVRAREGLLHLANRGTIFLDEVGDLALQAQAKFLRAIETREVYRLGSKRPEKLDVRIVAATNQDLDSALEAGRFRKDLYFRLNVARIHLPPLRERRSDIVPLLEHYLRTLNRGAHRGAAAFSPEAIAALQAYDWPGNVRELRNLVEAILVYPRSGRLDVRDFPEDFRRRLQHVCSLPAAERRRLLDALLTARWNKSRAATLLGWSRMTLYRKMAKYSVVTSDDVHAVSHRPATLSRQKSRT